MYVLDVVDEEVEEPHACSCTDLGSRGEEELTLVSGPAAVSPLLAAARRRNDRGDRVEVCG